MIIRPETKRILEIISLLERSTPASQIAQKLNVSPAAITELKKGRSNAGQKIIQKFVKQYKVSENWVYTGEGERFDVADVGGKKNDLQADVELLKQQFSLLQKEYELLSREAALMRDLVSLYKKKVKKSVTEDLLKSNRSHNNIAPDNYQTNKEMKVIFGKKQKQA